MSGFILGRLANVFSLTPTTACVFGITGLLSIIGFIIELKGLRLRVTESQDHS